MTPTSLKQQLGEIDSARITQAYDFRLGLIGVALKGNKNFYNGIQSITVNDKNGQDIEIPVTTKTLVRLTDKRGKRLKLCFDSIFLKDSLVYGSKSHFINLPVRPMKIDSIAKIEIQ